ncbi:MAG: SprT family zinc-dependent metalloprotease [Bacteroidales bacterium]|nr:SprT family zinc-dependent metalloprotease [Bacteroidales bacterium]
MTESVQFGSKIINFQVCFSNRKTLGITITPDMDVLVKAPDETSIEKIKEKVIKKAPWIIKQQNYFLGFFPKAPERQYVSGETHLYLGRQYRLKITDSKKNEVKYKGRFIEICTLKKEKAGSLLNKWYKERAKIKFGELAEPLIERFKKYNVEPKSLYVQEMNSRWGSCTSKGKIILNPELIKAPRPCIEYVIVHELCHLVHPNHNQKFIELQQKEMPDWQKWKEKLEKLMA